MTLIYVTFYACAHLQEQFKRSKMSVMSWSCALVVCLLPLVANGWWPFSGQTSSEPAHLSAEKDPDRSRNAAQFEMMSAEQKFLSEAQQFLDLSPLDQCLHGVVSRLRFSCGEMSEEELGKLSVQLLNCQSAAEARPTFTCTQHMSLSECTQPMDAHTWNTYHIISNRARSVCYATRQQQFRRQTELAVNKLSAATIDQLQAMEDLSNSQQQIKQATVDSLKSLQDHQSSMLESQKEILASQEGAREKLAHNLEQLTREKQLINSGQEQLTNMTKNIHQQLEAAADLLGDQEDSMRKGHRQIQEDISKVKQNIQQVWERVDSSTAELLQVMEEMGAQYEATMDNLRLINSSVSSMMGVVLHMQAMLSSQLDWVMESLGGAKDGLRVLTTLAIHAAFLFLAVLCVLFVKAPGLTRLSLLIIVSLNAVIEIRYKVSLTFVGLTILQTVIMLCNWIFLWRKQPEKPKSPLPQLRPLSPKLCDDWKDGCIGPEDPETITHTPSKAQPASSPPLMSRHNTPTPLSASLLQCEASSGMGLQCEARTRTGLQCKLAALEGGRLCRRHAARQH